MRYLFAALACSAAILVKYSSLVLYVILCMSLVLERRKRQLWTRADASAVLAAWSAFNYITMVEYISRLGTHNVNSILKPLRFSLYRVATIGG